MNKDEVKSNVTRFLGIILAYAAGRYHFSQETIGLVTSDIGYVGAIAAFLYGPYDHWNMKKVAETAKVIAGLLLVGIIVNFLVASPAQAQTATKAPAAAAQCPPNCSGFELGAGLGGVTTSLDVIGSGLNNSFLAGGAVPFVELGYVFDNGTYLIGVDFLGGNQFSTSINTPAGGGSQNGWLLEECGRAGFSLAGLFGTQTPIALPAALQNAYVEPYGKVCAVQRSFANALAGGAGAEVPLASHWALKLEYQLINYGAGTTNGNAKFTNENLTWFGIKYRW